MRLQDVIYYLVWAGLFFVMMRYGCGAHIIGHGHRHAKAEQDTGSAGGNLASPEQVTDPVCGMKLQSAAAKTSAYLGQVYYFCSQKCREKFEATPQSYANATSPAKEARHGCH